MGDGSFESFCERKSDIWEKLGNFSKIRKSGNLRADSLRDRTFLMCHTVAVILYAVITIGFSVFRSHEVLTTNQIFLLTLINIVFAFWARNLFELQRAIDVADYLVEEKLKVWNSTGIKDLYVKGFCPNVHAGENKEIYFMYAGLVFYVLFAMVLLGVMIGDGNMETYENWVIIVFTVLLFCILFDGFVQNGKKIDSYSRLNVMKKWIY